MFAFLKVIYDDRIEKWKIGESAVPHHMLLFVSGGSVVYYIGGDKIELRQGDILFVPAGSKRSCHNDDTGPHQKYSAHFTSSDEDEALLDVLRGRGYLRWQAHNADYFRQRFSMLLLQSFDPAPGGELICQGILLELIGRIVRDVQQNQASAIKRTLIQRLQTFIVHNHNKPIHLSDLAAHIDRSPNHITKIFKEVLGQTPIDYIHQVKISVACELLKVGSMTIAEISDHLGYCEQSYFHRMFKKFTGVAPSAVLKGQPVVTMPLPGSEGMKKNARS